MGLLRLTLLGLLACAGPQWRNADLQIDIEHAGVQDTDKVRICVQDVGLREQPVHAGAVAFPGLPLEGQLTIRIDRLDGDLRTARAGPVQLGGDLHYRKLIWTDCEEDCEPCTVERDRTSSAASDRLLAVRFLE